MTPETPLDTLNLTRVPPATQLQAWNAADELFLQRLAEADPSPGSILLVNDAFGALAIALAEQVAGWWNDSAMARSALETNSKANQTALPPVFSEADELGDDYAVIALHAPKSLTLLEWQLAQLAPRLAADGCLYVLGMVKHLSRGHQNTMARYFQDVRPGRAVKKARCVELRQPVPHLTPPTPKRYESLEHLVMVNHPGSFSEKAPDPGALAFLQHFDALPEAKTVVDLGCGNGILALTYLNRHPGARGILIDDSYQAIASSRDSAVANGLSEQVEVIHNNGLDGLELSNLPLILCNPPFHQSNTVTDDIAEMLFVQAHAALAPDGAFWVVGNRHLDYHRRLKRWFSQVSVMSRHPKFVVLRCERPR